ncbi:hypothetical protein [Brevundimonas sp.]|uniref:hypothetical protein n=1 Tax=Brevundimonas sp. TaxID=1871086 RepID=UPI002737BE5E|nr:hypothetical protein [Brevundimonas sp.]MDP3801682.1 hypothetical protein [Brevundimonas sp.]
MNSKDTYLAVFLGSGDGPRRATWNALSDDQRRAREQEGMAAWGAWVETHRDSIVDNGGPLGRTKRVSGDGVADVSNNLAVYVVVRAASHDAAARMFEDHPHFTHFPGDAVEVMPILPIPGP